MISSDREGDMAEAAGGRQKKSEQARPSVETPPARAARLDISASEALEKNADEPPSESVREGQKLLKELPARKVRENVEAIVSLEQLAESSINRHQRVIEHITAQAGRPGTLYAAILLVVGWITLNVVLEKKAFDPPPFDYLQLIVGSTALFVTLMILITQNRQAKIADQRAHLDLQVNLSTEQKVTKLVEMLDRVQRATTDRSSKLDPNVEALKVSVDPHAVVEALGGIVEDPHE
jgi:uncharacterized membrane protein